MARLNTNIFRLSIFVMSLAILSACNPPSSNGDETITRQQADEILKELRNMHILLEKIEKQTQSTTQQHRRPTTATLDIEEPGPILGAADAPVTVVEFTDYQCPFCKRFSQNTFPFLKRDYIDTGKVRWLVRDLPLGFHKHARKAAQAAYCAGEQDKYWVMRDRLFNNNSNLSMDRLKVYAADLGLDAHAFNDCLNSERYLALIDNYTRMATALHLTGTPSFVIGKTEPGKLRGKVIIGAQEPAVFAAEVQRLLSQR